MVYSSSTDIFFKVTNGMVYSSSTDIFFKVTNSMVYSISTDIFFKVTNGMVYRSSTDIFFKVTNGMSVGMVLQVTPEKKKSKGMMSGDLGGHSISSVPNVSPGKNFTQFFTIPVQ
jgi:hypothetical protein